MRDIEAVLEEAARQIASLEALYVESLQEKEIPPHMQARIKNILENQRSTLEYLAHAITSRYGSPGSRTYYPLAPNPREFARSIDEKMPGVRAARPDIAAAIGRHQSFQPDHSWLRHLQDLTNENKHQRLTPQTRHETRWVEVRGPGGSGIGFQPNQPGKGGVSFGGRVFLGGVEVDPVNLQPLGGPKPYTETIYVDWLFELTGTRALTTLRLIQTGVSEAVADIRAVANL